MYPFMRAARVVAGALGAARVDVLDTVTITLPVTRADVEAVHMNNGRYVTLMDLGRFALTVRGGYLPILVRRRWVPVVASVMVRFSRSIRVSTTFDLSTRIVCWDARYFFVEQWFEQGGDVRARGFVKALFKGPRGPVGSEELLRAGGFRAVSPPLPDSVRAWQVAEDAAFPLRQASSRNHQCSQGGHGPSLTDTV